MNFLMLPSDGMDGKIRIEELYARLGLSTEDFQFISEKVFWLNHFSISPTPPVSYGRWCRNPENYFCHL